MAKTPLIAGLLMQLPAVGLIGAALPEAEATVLALVAPLLSGVVVVAAVTRGAEMSGAFGAVAVAVVIIAGLAAALYLYVIGGLVGATLFGDPPSPMDVQLARLLQMAAGATLVGAVGAAVVAWRCVRGARRSSRDGDRRRP